MGAGGTDPAVLLMGVPWSPAEFVQEAKGVEDPFDVLPAVKVGARRAIFIILVNGPAAVARHRRKVLGYWGTRRRALDGEGD